MPAARPEVLVEAGNLLGESPVWDDAASALWWVDIHGRTVHRHSQRHGHGAWPLAEQVGCIALAAGGGLVAGTRTGFGRLDVASGTLAPLATQLPRTAPVRFNDGRADRRGRFWSATVSERRVIGEAALYRLDPDGRAQRAHEGITVGNGIAQSPDGRTLYYADSHVREIYACELDADSGRLGPRRLLARFAEGEGLPDGATVDVDGCLWIAAIHGARLMRLTPRGDVDRVVPMPVSQPTSVSFGGADLGTLYVTSARMRLDDAALAREPLAGSVFALDVGVGGFAEPRYGREDA
jgi:sugar lactone lactonase YvrE